MKPHFLQSSAWQHFQELQGAKTFTAKGPNWSFLAILDHTPLGNYLFVPYGPFLSEKKALKSALQALTRLAYEKNAFFIRIEPTLLFSRGSMRKFGLRKTTNIDPEHTWILNLEPSETEILAQMKQNNRNLYKNHAKKGLSFSSTQDPNQIHILSQLLAQVSQHNHFSPHHENYLKNQLEAGFATLYFANFNRQVIAAALVYDDDDTRYYAHAAADYSHRKLSAGTSLLVQIILDAKKNGQTRFDFWGITPSNDPKHPWYGFTKFKQSFGGEILNYSGTYDLPIKKLNYVTYSLLRPINRKIQKIHRP